MKNKILCRIGAKIGKKFGKTKFFQKKSAKMRYIGQFSKNFLPKGNSKRVYGVWFMVYRRVGTFYTKGGDFCERDANIVILRQKVFCAD